jgi:hypothetical protein
MTDAPGMEQPPAPVVVNADIVPEGTWQTVRVLIIFGAGIGLDHWVHDGTVIAAGMAAVTALLTYGVGLAKMIHSKNTLAQLVHLLPDELARFK